MSLSSVKSETALRSRLFSSSRSFRRFTCSVFSPPNSWRHRYYVTSLTPIWRIASAMFWPCETRTSTCRNFATISSGLYRFLVITVLLDVKDIPQVGPLQWGRITMGEDLKSDELETFCRLTEREQPPKERVSELVAVVGRRGGKSRAIATLLCYLACLIDYRPRLASGETGVALCIAPSQEQAKIVLDYASGILEASPILRQLVRRSTSETIELNNRVVISVRSASYRRLRGQTCIACIADEAAFWFNEDSSNPDYEILNAVRPSLATTGGLLCVISSPYARRGVLWDSFKNHFG